MLKRTVKAISLSTDPQIPVAFRALILQPHLGAVDLEQK